MATDARAPAPALTHYARGLSRRGGPLTRFMLLPPLPLALVSAAAFLLVILALSAGVVREIEAHWRGTTEHMLTDMARLMAANVDGDLHASLVSPEQMHSPTYDRLLEPLVRLQNAAPQIFNLYTLRMDPDGRNVRYVLDTANSPALLRRGDAAAALLEPAGFDFDSEPRTLQALFAERRPYVEQLPYALGSSGRVTRTVDAPVFDSAGRIVGVLGIDVEERLFRERLQIGGGSSVAALVLSALIAAFIGGVVYWSRQRIGIALALLDRRVVTDALTGLHNRRDFDARLDEAVAGARRHGQSLSLLVFDIDHFKRINDTHGHLAGDDVLRAVAGHLRQALRRENPCCRIGGEEFGVVLPDADADGAAAVYRRIREAVREPVTVGDTELVITISGGISCLAGHESADELLRRADGALYAAKAGGRDRVVVAQSPARAA